VAVDTVELESKILQIIRELAVQLELRPTFYKRIPKVLWQDYMPGGRGPRRILSSDQCKIGPDCIILPDRMRHLMDAEDWRPIIASSLAFDNKLTGTIFRHFMKRWGLPVLFPLVLLSTVLTLLYQPKADASIPFVIIGITLFVSLAAYGISAPFLRRVKLRADQLSASVTGQANFLRVLTKIDKLGLQDLVELERRRGLRAYFTVRPTLSERITNLETNEPLQI